MRQMMTWGLGLLVLALGGCADAGGNGQAATRYSSAVPGEARQNSSWTARGGEQASRTATVAVYSADALAVNGKNCRRGDLLDRLRRLDCKEIQLQPDRELSAGVVAELLTQLSREGYTVYILPPEETRVEYH